MIPKPPPREPQLGFIYQSPYRVQGVGVAGEATCIQVPELDICFDVGTSPRASLAMNYAMISHGHMDHIGGLAYWCSQRQFQGMGIGTIICHKAIESAIHTMMKGYVDLERQKTPYHVTAIEPGDEIKIKNNTVIRAFETDHTVESLGYSIIEKRSKLKEELMGLPQSKLCEIKARGEEITYTVEVPLISYTGDTLPGPWLLTDTVLNSKIVISECTFLEDDHKSRAKVGKHMHLDDIAEWLPLLRSELVVLTHISRRTHMGKARKAIAERLGKEAMERVELLMDHRRNRERYEAQEKAIAGVPISN